MLQIRVPPLGGGELPWSGGTSSRGNSENNSPSRLVSASASLSTSPSWVVLALHSSSICGTPVTSLSSSLADPLPLSLLPLSLQWRQRTPDTLTAAHCVGDAYGGDSSPGWLQYLSNSTKCLVFGVCTYSEVVGYCWTSLCTHVTGNLSPSTALPESKRACVSTPSTLMGSVAWLVFSCVQQEVT